MICRSLAAWICAAVASWASTADGAGYAPQVGRAHADFVLPSLADGTPVSLWQFRGRKVLLIHFASW